MVKTFSYLISYITEKCSNSIELPLTRTRGDFQTSILGFKICLFMSPWNHLTQTAPNMRHFLFGTKFALFGHSYRRLPLQVVLWNVFQEFVNPDLLSIHRWSYGIVLYEVFTIGRLFVIFSYNAVNYSITLIEAMDGCFVFCQ